VVQVTPPPELLLDEVLLDELLLVDELLLLDELVVPPLELELEEEPPPQAIGYWLLGSAPPGGATQS
jgi:hypothetical protein